MREQLKRQQLDDAREQEKKRGCLEQRKKEDGKEYWPKWEESWGTVTSWELKGKERAGVFSVSDATERGKEDGRVKRSFGNSFIRKLLVPTDRSTPGKWW